MVVHIKFPLQLTSSPVVGFLHLHQRLAHALSGQRSSWFNIFGSTAGRSHGGALPGWTWVHFMVSPSSTVMAMSPGQFQSDDFRSPRPSNVEQAVKRVFANKRGSPHAPDNEVGQSGP